MRRARTLKPALVEELKDEDLPIPADCGGKVDIIISEWMGYFLLYESMLDTVIVARDRWLKKDQSGAGFSGLIFPDRATLRVQALEDAEYKEEKIHFWDNVYGFDMSPVQQEMRDASQSDASVEVVPADTLLSASAPFRAVAVATATDAELDFTAPFQLAASAAGTLRCLVVHFDTHFAPPGATASSFSTASTCSGLGAGLGVRSGLALRFGFRQRPAEGQR